MKKPSQMDRVRGARLVINKSGSESDQDMELAAFMAIFHPNVKGKRLESVIKGRKK